jgi:hypothetical protein
MNCADHQKDFDRASQRSRQGRCEEPRDQDEQKNFNPQAAYIFAENVEGLFQHLTALPSFPDEPS